VALLRQLLPVLSYIHSVGVIHRDIAPDNLICREGDGLPILIDFGGVKQIAAEVLSQYSGIRTTSATRLGKVGFAPGEQMQRGAAYPHSDIYSLAASVLVLMTGQDPQELMDPFSLDWTWRQHLDLDPRFGEALDRMLALRPSDRYGSAEEALAALEGLPEQAVPAPEPSRIPTTVTQVVAPTGSGTTRLAGAAPTRLAAADAPEGEADDEAVADWKPWRWVGWLALVAAIAIGGGWLLARGWMLLQSRPQAPQTVLPSLPNLGDDAQARREQIRNQLQAMQVNPDFFETLVNQSYLQAHPERGDRLPGAGPDEAPARDAWFEVANAWLTRLSILPPQVRSNLGRYSSSDYEAWARTVSRQALPVSAFREMVAARYRAVFPDLPLPERFDQPLGQVWYAIAADAAALLSNSPPPQTLSVAPNQETSSQGSLGPGESRVFLVSGLPGQTLQLNLDAGSGVRLAIFDSRGATLLPGSSDTRTWSAPGSGSYRLLLTSVAAGTETFALQLRSATAPTTTPVETSDPTLETTPAPEQPGSDTPPAAPPTRPTAPTPRPAAPVVPTPQAPTPQPTAPRPPEPSAPTPR
jgi:serine/threonine-protein kinase